MREPHALCVNLTHRQAPCRPEICVFIGVFELASIVLNNVSKRVDSVSGSFKVRGLFTEKNQKNSKLYEEPRKKIKGFHSDRVVSRNRYHRHSGGYVAAGACPCQSPRATY